MKSIVVILVLVSACATNADDAPSAAELAELDQWADTADGKADLPGSFSAVVAWLRDVYTRRMSAIWNDQEHPASASAALARIDAGVRASGRDPARVLYPTSVRRLDAGVIDHSEIDIAVAHGMVVRLVGDPKGAGAFVDGELFEDPVGPPLCLTHAELEIAVTAAYAPGAYAVSYVCHSITERVLRALGIGTARYASQFRTYAAARWTWGPVLPSWNPQDPARWPQSRACPTPP